MNITGPAHGQAGIPVQGATLSIRLIICIGGVQVGRYYNLTQVSAHIPQDRFWFTAAGPSEVET